MKKQRLELTWIGKDERPRLEPRILLEDAEKSYHAAIRNDGDIFDNRLIFGDNLLALKALEEEFLGKLKCIYIDPPYNTGGDFFYYEDGLEHSRWLSMMRDRLTIMWGLLAENGSIWISIDDNEIHYLKVIMDEIFGRTNFVATVIWQKNFSPKSTARHLSASHDYILVYVKNIDLWERNLLPRGEDSNKGYRNPDNDPRGVWTSGDLSARNFYGAGTYPITAANGRVIPGPPRGMYWRFSKDRFLELDKDNRIWWGKDGNNQPRLKRFLSEVRDGVVPQTIWLHTEVGNTQESKKEIIDIIPDAQEVFQTAKPERLIRRILELATNPGDLVLDSFAGSGTTGAVAHKMGRRWIMVELGEHCQTHIIPRLKKVIDGEDKGGVSEAVDWQGGGGFQYYRLAPSLLEKDRFGNWIIAKEYNAAMLAEAVCKLMGFKYDPSQELEEYWQHGYSTESDFIYVTTQSLTHDALKKLADEVGPDRTLLVCCKAYNAREAAFPNLTVKKIPHTVLSKCEWGRDDYSLSVSNLPAAETIKPQTADGEDTPAEATQKPRARKRKVVSTEPSLFSDVEGK